MPDLPFSPSDSEYSLSSHSSLSDTQTTTIDTQDLPVPTAPQPFPTKKSHARKQPQGHIPRPRNAFILFRCDYTRQKQCTLQQFDQNGVSRMVGEIWRKMNADQREPWVLMAEAEKKKHAALYPGYKYNPRTRKPPPTQESVERLMVREAEKVVTAEVAAREREERKRKMVEIYYPPWATRRSQTQFARRAMSCPPPGAIGVEPYSELVDRAIVTTDGSHHEQRKAAHVQSAPNSPTVDSFVPSTYNIQEVDSCPPSGRVTPDRLLSECLYTIDPPGGTNSWGDPSLPESSQGEAQQDGPQVFAPRPMPYAPPGTFMANPESYATESIDHSDTFSSSPETPPFDPSSPSGSSSSSSSIQSPTTPTMPHSWPPVHVASSQPQDASPEAYREFVSEFGSMNFQPSWAPYFMIPKDQTW